MSPASWIWENKEWLFQGVGATAVIALVGMLFRSSRRRVEPTALAVDAGAFLSTIGDAPKPSGWWLFAEKIPGLKRVAREKIYTEQEIDRRVRVRVSSDGEGMSFWKMSDHGSLSIWLDFVNLNPFPLKIECITGHATVAGSAVAEIKIVDRHNIPALAWHAIHLETVLTEAQIERIKSQLSQRMDVLAGLNLRIYAKNDVRELTLVRNTESGNRRFVNFNSATSENFFDRLVPVAAAGYSIDPKNGEAVCPKCASEGRPAYLLAVGENFYCQACNAAIKGQKPQFPKAEPPGR